MIGRFRKWGDSLLWHLSHHRPPGGWWRGNGLCRLFNLLDGLLRLSDLPDRSVRDCDHQHGRSDDGSQNTCELFRIHLDTPRQLPTDIAENPTHGEWGSAEGKMEPLHAARFHRNHVRFAWSLRDLGHPASGIASSRGWTCTIDGNPVGFCLIISMKAAFVGLAIAEIFYAFGLVGDPFAQIRRALPFLT
jgi:hypothetical protein